MNKINYQRELDQILAEITAKGEVPTLLLHSCCAPCSSYVLEYLSQYFKITVFYYNPNIYPESEYTKRILEQQKLIEEMHFRYPVSFLAGKYDRDRFDVISISLDSKKEDWQKALEEEKMPWPQFIAGNRGYEQLTLRYNINSIPNLILIDDKGQVVCNTFSPEEISIELEEILR